MIARNKIYNSEEYNINYEVFYAREINKWLGIAVRNGNNFIEYFDSRECIHNKFPKIANEQLNARKV